MEIKGNFLKKGFLIVHKRKKYYVDYVGADYPSSLLLNRDDWEVTEDDGEEISPHIIKSVKNEKEEEDVKLYYKLVDFCIKNFDKFNPIIM